MNTTEGQTSDQTVLIIGGGIGGLGAAIGFQEVGFDIEVYERTPEFREVGAGLTIMRNGLEALDELGGHEAAVRAGTIPRVGEFRTPDGSVLREIHFQSILPSDSDMPVMITLHRADLQRILRERVADGDVHLDHECVGVDQDGEQVTARFASGKEVSGDLLVGADRIHSVTRSSLHGEEDPRFTGVGIWRAVTRFNHPMLSSDGGFGVFGDGKRFGVGPIGNDRVYWFASERVQQGTDRPGADSKERLAEAFGDWHDPIPALIEATPREALIWDEAADRKLLDEWGRGNITLLGDAAHIALPYMGQGASLALEDAVWLSRYLDRELDTAAALRTYEAHRQDRTAKIVRSARRLGRIQHLSNPIAVAARNLAWKYAPGSVLERTYRQGITTEI